MNKKLFFTVVSFVSFLSAGSADDAGESRQDWSMPITLAAVGSGAFITDFGVDKSALAYGGLLCLAAALRTANIEIEKDKDYAQKHREGKGIKNGVLIGISILGLVKVMRGDRDSMAVNALGALVLAGICSDTVGAAYYGMAKAYNKLFPASR